MSGYSPMCFECDRPAWICARYGHLHQKHKYWCNHRMTGGEGSCDCRSTTIELAPNQPQRDPLPTIAEDLL